MLMCVVDCFFIWDCCWFFFAHTCFYSILFFNLVAHRPTSWASQKTNNVSESSSATAFASGDLKIRGAESNTTLHTRKKKNVKNSTVFFSDLISPKYQRKLECTNFSTILINLVPPTILTLVGTDVTVFLPRPQHLTKTLLINIIYSLPSFWLFFYYFAFRVMVDVFCLFAPGVVAYMCCWLFLSFGIVADFFCT